LLYRSRMFLRIILITFILSIQYCASYAAFPIHKGMDTTTADTTKVQKRIDKLIGRLYGPQGTAHTGKRGLWLHKIMDNPIYSRYLAYVGFFLLLLAVLVTITIGFHFLLFLPALAFLSLWFAVKKKRPHRIKDNTRYNNKSVLSFVLLMLSFLFFRYRLSDHCR